MCLSAALLSNKEKGFHKFIMYIYIPIYLCLFVCSIKNYLFNPICRLCLEELFFVAAIRWHISRRAATPVGILLRRRCSFDPARVASATCHDQVLGKLVDVLPAPRYVLYCPTMAAVGIIGAHLSGNEVNTHMPELHVTAEVHNADVAQPPYETWRAPNPIGLRERPRACEHITMPCEHVLIEKGTWWIR